MGVGSGCGYQKSVYIIKMMPKSLKATLILKSAHNHEKGRLILIFKKAFRDSQKVTPTSLKAPQSESLKTISNKNHQILTLVHHIPQLIFAIRDFNS